MVAVFRTKSKLIIPFIFFSIFFIKCDKSTGEKNRVQAKKIDFSKAQVVQREFKEIAKEDQFIQLQLPDSIHLGKIETIRFTDQFLILHDRDLAKALYLFNHDGTYINQLRKIGGGEGEYKSLESFATNKENEVFIYDRNQQKIMKYSLPHFKYISSKALEVYLTELVNTENGFLAISDEVVDEDYYYGQIIIDKNFETIENTPMKPATVEVTQSKSFSTENTGKLYYSVPFTEEIYQYNSEEDKLKSEFLIDYGAHKIPKKVLNYSDEEDFMAFITSTAQTLYFATHNFNISSKGIISLNFYTNDIDTKLQGLFDLNTNKGLILDNLGPLSDYIIAPLSVQKGFNISLFYPGEYSKETLRQLGMNVEEIEYINTTKPIIYKYQYASVPF